MNEQSRVEMQMKEFCTLQQNINRVYEDYARKHNFSYTNGQILSLIECEPDCTQKKIMEMTFLPKQTINNVITSFYKQGWVYMVEVPEDRRSKVIHLTEKGKEIAEPYLSRLHKAEFMAMKNMSEEQRTSLLEGMRLYYQIFNETMQEHNK